MPRIKSMDVTIAGVTRSYEWDPPVEVESDDEGSASLELLESAETTEVEFMDPAISSATVTVEFTVTYSSSIEVELEDLDVEDVDDLVVQVAEGDFDSVSDQVLEDLSNADYSNISIDSVDVQSAQDENGDDIDI